MEGICIGGNNFVGKTMGGRTFAEKSFRGENLRGENLGGKLFDTTAGNAESDGNEAFLKVC